MTGVLHDLTKVSLFDCVTPPAPSSVSRDKDRYYWAKIFPHFVVLGDRHLHPGDRVISQVDFLIDDADTLFEDPEAFGRLIDARPHIEQIANANALGRRIITGPHPEILYFSGKQEIFTVSTALGRIFASHHPSCNFGARNVWSLRSRTFISIAFEERATLHEAVLGVFQMTEYLGLIIGRPQNLVDLRALVGGEHDESVPLTVYWSMPPNRDSATESREPSSFDVLIDPVRRPDQFASVLERWLDRQKDWHSARRRFFDSFARQRRYDVDRLIGSANMFDILPNSAVPTAVELPDPIKSAQSAARDLFRGLPKTPERDSVLSALGRIGKGNLKQKVRHRVRNLAELFPDLTLVTDEAINCRNYYVHGGEPPFDYNGNFAAVVFFSNTLEFVFAASDLIEAGWDIKSWIAQGTTASHPFAGYCANYAEALRDLKALLAKSTPGTALSAD